MLKPNLKKYFKNVYLFIWKAQRHTLKETEKKTPISSSSFKCLQPATVGSKLKVAARKWSRIPTGVPRATAAASLGLRQQEAAARNWRRAQSPATLVLHGGIVNLRPSIWSRLIFWSPFPWTFWNPFVDKHTVTYQLFGTMDFLTSCLFLAC